MGAFHALCANQVQNRLRLPQGRKNSGACFLCNLPVYKAMTAVLLPPEASPAIWGRPQHEKARQILLDNRQKLGELARYLYEKETITGEEFMDILNRKSLSK